MFTTRYESADEYLQVTQGALEQNEAANSLMLGICQQLKRSPQWYGTSPYFATVQDREGLVLAGVMTPPFKIVLYGHKPDLSAPAEMIARDLRDNGWSVPGVLGPSDVASTFAAGWTATVGQPHRPRMRQRVYQLTEVTHLGSVRGRLRLATVDDLELVNGWLLAFNMDAFGQVDQEQTQKLARKKIRAREFFLWEDGKPVSMAAKARPTANGIAVGGVYTPPEWRRQGYATACVANLSQLLLDSGRRFCALFTDLANPTSNSIYQRIGYRPVCDFHEYAFGFED